MTELSKEEQLYRIANHIASTKGALPNEWQPWADEIESGLRKLVSQERDAQETDMGEIRVGRLPTINQDEYPGLGDWWVQLRIGEDSDEVLARVYGATPQEAINRAEALACRAAMDAATISNSADFEIEELSLVTAPVSTLIPEDYFSLLVSKARPAAEKAMRKFPQPNYVLLKVAEEAGEVVQAGVHYAERRMSWEQVEGEIVQLLAMLIRLVTEGDQINGVTPPEHTRAVAPQQEANQ